MSKILIASDPELFVKTRDGIITSFAGVIGHGKTNKLDLGNGVRIQEDNVLLEFDIDPFNTFSGFDEKMLEAIKACSDIAGKHDLELAQGLSSHIFTKPEIMSFHKSALEFGCEPDYNALNGMRFPKPRCNPGLRTAGGHVHIGYDHFKEVNNIDQKTLAILCDYYLSLPALLVDTDDRRRQLYGKAGATRFKEYGIEYRSLSNFWIAEKANRQMVWDQTQKAFEAMNEDRAADLWAMIDPEEVQRVINTGDRAMAEQYIKLAEII